MICKFNLSVNEHQFVSNKSKVAKLRSVDRIMTLPIVESGWNFAGQVYGRLKQSSNVLHWACGQAETSFNFVLNTTTPVVILLNYPISTLDTIVCQGLDTVEEKMPAIHLPPEKIYWNTKQYVSDVGNIIMRPILKRADSVKQIGTTVLESKYTTFAADKLEGALNVADKYVDKYLPADLPDTKGEENNASATAYNPTQRAYKTIHHMDQLSRKLQRRLTCRTLAEAKAFKEHSAEAIHVLTYIVELIANDPKTAFYKSKELWSTLSNNEPENQARPKDLDELIMLITRESARRFVHVVNFTSTLITALSAQMRIFTNNCLHTLDDLAKPTQLENMNQTLVEGARIQAHKFTLLLYHLNLFTTDKLQHIAKSLEQQEQNIKSLPPTSRQLSSNTPRDSLHLPVSKTHIKASHRFTTITNGIGNANK